MRKGTLLALLALMLAVPPSLVRAHPNQHKTKAAAKSAMKSAPVAKAYSPRHAGPERRAIVRALRSALNVKSHFEVGHLKVNGTWAYIRCNEVLFVHDKMKETDLGVEALLERQKTGPKRGWHVVELWTLPGNEDHPREKFFENIKKRQAERKIPKDIFPADLGVR